MSHFIAPSLLSADFGRLNEQIAELNKSNADLLHIDVMDGVFVPNISFGFPVINAIAAASKKPLDFHLMISDPDMYISRFAEYKPEYISIHFENNKHLNRSIQLIHDHNIKAGVAINPHTNPECISEILHFADLILIMSVNPGFGGQKFIENTLNKIEKTKKLISKHHLNTKIEVDGGIDLSNYKKVINKGANIIVAGNAVFKTGNIVENIEEFKTY